MRPGIVRTVAWWEGWGTWVHRGGRWLYVALASNFLVVHKSPIWVLVAIMMVCLYGELRDWNSRKRGYSFYLHQDLLLSIGNSTSVAVFVLLYVSNLTEFQNGKWLSTLVVLNLIILAHGVKSEVSFQRGLIQLARIAPAALPPPLVAEYILYIALPCRAREPLLGDLNEDFATNVVPKFGPLCAYGWYWYKAVLYIWIYACDNAIEPLIRRVIEPLWRRVVLPILQWIVAPALLAHRQGWTEAIRAFMDRLR